MTKLSGFLVVLCCIATACGSSDTTITALELPADPDAAADPTMPAADTKPTTTTTAVDPVADRLAAEDPATAHYETWPDGPTAEDYGEVPSEVVVREFVLPGEVPEPPTIKVFGEGITMELPIWTTCWLASIASDGTQEHYCSDGWRGPSDELQRVRGAGPLYVEFPLAGWAFGATAVPAAEEQCGRFQKAWLSRIAPTVHELVPQGFVDTYIVDVYGRGPGGDVISSFVWETTVDGVLAVPRASMGLLWEDDGQVTSYTAGLEISGLATTPDSASATVTVTAANGASTEVRYEQDEPEGCPGVGEVDLDAHPGDAMRAAALGEVPFAYDVELTMDGSVFRASASWPLDEYADHPGYVPLNFEPALPALVPSDAVTSLGEAAEPAVDEFLFALWGPWNDGTEAPPQPDSVVHDLAGVVEFDGPCAYMVADVAAHSPDSREPLFGPEPGQYVRVLLVFPDDSPLGRTSWDAAEETVSYKGKKLRAGDFIETSDWYYSRYAELGVRLPLRWGQAGKRYIQEPDDSCETGFVLGL